MDLNFAIICEHAFIDNSNRISIIQAFDAIFAKDFPALHPKITVVTNYSASTKDPRQTYSQDIRIFNPEGEKIADLTQTISRQGEEKNLQLISYFINLPLKKAGHYKIEISLNGKKKKELLVDVIKIPAQKSSN